ncbi:MAG: glutamine synthetase III [Candidatus Micrarchaeota archaeon]|nr:glutamine synthetase III [Candidatus Micrarchaeota archaeon]
MDETKLKFNGIVFGESSLTIEKLELYMDRESYKKLLDCVRGNQELPLELANAVAIAIMRWAIENKAYHYCHWFQPLNGMTAEKHETFSSYSYENKIVFNLRGKELIKGEPDASSFPSGGARSTYEARGYTIYDITSPIFIKYNNVGRTICIPTAFISYHGDALDEKTPLLRARRELSKAIKRLLKVIENKSFDGEAKMFIGPEQEYFLIPKELYYSRQDLLLCGRTLFGNKPSKHQQMEDNYFGSVKDRIIAFMEELDTELWRLGIPAKTRHNEVAPAQHEIALLYSEANVGVDQNLILMDLMKSIAMKHGLVCLLHEKPFAGINGSGKHLNFSISSPDGSNLFDPGDSAHENEKFLAFLIAMITAANKWNSLIFASVASAGNEHRLGANEAPPAIISVYLGDELTNLLEHIQRDGKVHVSRQKEFIDSGLLAIPKLPKDVSDRNRTSPLAFTGNKFEFRAVGSSMNCAFPTTVLMTVLTDAIHEVADKLEAHLKAKHDLKEALIITIRELYSKHKRVVFNGDNYSNEWKEEAKRRGLKNHTSAPEALKELIKKETIELFTKYNILSEKELQLRYNAYFEKYEKTINYEAKTLLEMTKVGIIPSIIKYEEALLDTLSEVNELKLTRQKAILSTYVTDYSEKASDLMEEVSKLEHYLNAHDIESIKHSMAKLRDLINWFENEVDQRHWNYPKYYEILFTT